MSIRVMCAPLWMRWVIMSLLFAAGLAVATVVVSPDMFGWGAWLVGCVVCCVVFGGLVAYGQRRYAGRYADALAGLDGEQRWAAITAVNRGPVPTDPAVTAAAVRLGAVLADAQRVVTNRAKLYVALAVLWALLAIGSFVTRNAGLGVLYAVVAVLTALTPPLQRRSVRRLEERMALLAAESTA